MSLATQTYVPSDKAGIVILAAAAGLIVWGLGRASKMEEAQVALSSSRCCLLSLLLWCLGRSCSNYFRTSILAAKEENHEASAEHTPHHVQDAADTATGER